MRGFNQIGVFALFVALSNGASAQSSENDSVDIEYKNVKKELLSNARDAAEGIVKQNGPLDRVGTGTMDPMFEFSSDSDESRIALSFKLDITRSSPNDSDITVDKGEADLSSFVLGIKASAPLAQDSKTDSPFFSFGNLNSGSNISLSLNYFSTRVGDGLGAEQYLVIAYKNCFQTEGQNWAGVQKDPSIALLAAENFVKGYLKAAEVGGRVNRDAFWSRRAHAGAAAGSLEKHIFDRCIVGAANAIKDETQLVGIYVDKSARRVLRKTYVKSNTIKFGGIDATLARQSFDVLDALAFEKNSVDRTAVEAAAYFGLIWPTADTSLRLKGSYLKKYEAADEGTICQIPEGGTSQCLTGPNGIPALKSSWVASIEGRKQFELGGQSMAIAPQLTFDVSDKEWALDMPIYLTKDPEDTSKLNGGIRFGYRSDKDDFGIGLFVGIPFTNWF